MRARPPRAAAPEHPRPHVAGREPGDVSAERHSSYELRPGYVGRLKEQCDVAIGSTGKAPRPQFSPGAKKPVRILAVGDSFTFGWGVEAEEAPRSAWNVCFPRRSARDVSDQRRLRRRLFSQTPTTSFCGDALNPDLIVIGFFVGNDIDHVRAFERVDREVDPGRGALRIINVDSVDERAGWWRAAGSFATRSICLRPSPLPACRRGGKQIGGGRTSAAGRSTSEIPFVFRVAYEERTRRLNRAGSAPVRCDQAVANELVFR